MLKKANCAILENLTTDVHFDTKKVQISPFSYIAKDMRMYLDGN